MPLTSLSLVKQLLGLSLSDTSQDAQLSALQTAAERAVKSYCGRDFEPGTYTEYLQGNGKKDLVLRQRPVTSVTSVYLDWSGNIGQNPDGSFPTSALLTAGIDYALQYDGTWNGAQVSFSGCLVRIRNVWPEIQRQYYWTKLSPEVGESRGSIKVVYTAGYSPLPEDLQYAVAYIVAGMRRMIPVGGNLFQERIGDYSYEIGKSDRGQLPWPELGEARQILNRYRELSL